jgi:hypothetical protein
MVVITGGLDENSDNVLLREVIRLLVASTDHIPSLLAALNLIFGKRTTLRQPNAGLISSRFGTFMRIAISSLPSYPKSV